ncbi:MAG: iron ABC transporter permease [Phototrophicales bacterium]|nr:MAG: iron ABC transporter permease [Phototrophicales bacterium]RMG75203.1 MAG: iron ABC transporter permease [Chloroflexota bacterium]
MRRVVFLIPLVFLAGFFFFPLASIMDLSLRPQGQFDLSSFGAVIGERYYRDVLWFTIWQAIVSTLLTLGLALPGAYIVTRYRFWGKSILMSLATLPFVLPTVVVAAAFASLIFSRGILNDLLMAVLPLDSPPLRFERTLTAIFVAHVFYNYAVALRMISGYWANQSPRMEEAARVLGCHGWRLWWEIRLPILRPAILASAVLVFIFTFTSFGVVLILGGPKYATLEVEIYNQTLVWLDLPMAAALSLVQIGVMFFMMLIYTRLQRSTVVTLQSVEQVARRPYRWEWLLISGNLIVMIGLLFAPLGALILRSVAGESGFTLEHYINLSRNPRGSILFVPPLQAISNSVQFALIAMMTATFLGTLTAYLIHRVRWLDAIFMLPLATSAVTLGFGYTVSMDFDGVRQLLGVDGDWDLRTWVGLIPVAHTLVALPFVVRSVLPALRSIPPNIKEAAAVLGASPWWVWWRIELPLISRGIFVGATFAFTISMGEFGASVFIARRTPTMPLVIEQLLGQPGAANYSQAFAMSAILMMVCAVAFILIERVRTAGVGEF